MIWDGGGGGGEGLRIREKMVLELVVDERIVIFFFGEGVVKERIFLYVVLWNW